MANPGKARVFTTARRQSVLIPAAFRFSMDEVSIRRDPLTGDIILSQIPEDWAAIYSALDKAGFPEDFLADRKQ